MLLILTPTSHLNVFQKDLKNSDLPFVEYPNISDPSDISEEHGEIATSVFLNPNKQRFIFDKSFHKVLPNLEHIFTASTGTLHIETQHFSRKQIKVHSLKNDLNLLSDVPSTADLAFCHLLNWARNIHPAIRACRHGIWDFEPFIGKQIKDLKVGIVGLGRLGKIFAKYSSIFGSEVSYVDPITNASPKGFKRIDTLEELFEVNDVVSLHVHPEKKPIVTARHLVKAKGKPFCLINTSRGEVVDEAAVCEALEDHSEFCYYSDVLCDEQAGLGQSKIYKHFRNEVFGDRLILSPHLGGSTQGAQEAAYGHTLRKFFSSQQTHSDVE